MVPMTACIQFKIMNDRFKPPTLSIHHMQQVQDQLQMFNRRREDFRLSYSPLRLLVDGDQLLEFDPATTPQKTVRLPESAVFIELRGEDARGDLLLAAFLAPDYTTSLKHFIDSVTLRHLSGRLVQIELSAAPSRSRFPAMLLLLKCLCCAPTTTR